MRDAHSSDSVIKVIEDRARVENQPEGLIFADRNKRNTILDFIDPEPYDHDDGTRMMSITRMMIATWTTIIPCKVNYMKQNHI